ncbi:DUF177 domain-containing protein [Bdellovibrionota bacterium FG-2]
MKIFLRAINESGTDLHFTHEDPWVLDSIKRVDETSHEDSSALDLSSLRANTATKKNAHQKREAQVSFNLRMVDEVVLANGKLETSLNLLCSRCGAPFEFGCNATISALFCKDPVMAGVGYLGEGGKPAGQVQGFARHAHDMSSGEPGQDLDITYITQDFIDLGELLTEQVQLQVPFQPLCDEDCKGLCVTCGTDLNSGRCGCAKIQKSSPFTVLKDLKLS